MINLKDMAEKLDSVLNGTDTEIPSGLTAPSNDNYFFKVFSQGLYLSNLSDKNSGKNFIPVIIGGFGGENNPVADLGEKDRNATIEIYFPVRLKDEMFEIEDYLNDVFVGRELTFGSQKAVCNLSPAQFGELQDFDFNMFKEWVETNYLQTIEKMETYMAMTITLYISSAKNVGSSGGFVYGNAYSYALSISIADEDEESGYRQIFNDSPVFVGGIDNATSSPASQQILGDSSANGLAITTAYTKQITFYYKDTEDYAELLNAYLGRHIQDLKVEITSSFDLPGAEEAQILLNWDREYYVTDMTFNFTKGQLVTVTITLGDLLEI